MNSENIVIKGITELIICGWRVKNIKFENDDKSSLIIELSDTYGGLPSANLLFRDRAIDIIFNKTFGKYGVAINHLEENSWDGIKNNSTQLAYASISRVKELVDITDNIEIIGSKITITIDNFKTDNHDFFITKLKDVNTLVKLKIDKSINDKEFDCTLSAIIDKEIDS